MLLAFIHRPQEGIPTSGSSQSTFAKGGLEFPTPLWEEKLSDLNVLANHRSVLEGRRVQTREMAIPQGEAEGAFSKREHAYEESASVCGVKPRDQRAYFGEPQGRLLLRGSLPLSAGPWEDDLVHS